MMAHRARLMPGSTFRLNLCCAGPYNADFDGDEMNMHLVQSTLGAAEVRCLMAVPQQTVSPQANRPVMGIVQDTLLGSALLTRPGTFLTRREFFRLVMWIRYPRKDITKLPPPAISHPIELWTGSQLFSALLPTDLTVLRGALPSQSAPLPPSGSDCVLIRGGNLMYGSLTKSMLGTASNGIIDVLARDSATLTVQFMSDVQRLVNQWLLTQGFSVRVSDCVMSAEGHAKVAECVAHASRNAGAILEADLPESMQMLAEGTVINILSKLLMQTGSIAREHSDPDSSIATMVAVGSKGNSINTSQISGCVGQQSVEGRRIFFGDRTLNSFKPNDRRLITNGFVMNSYSLGLQPEEFFFHSMGGREGLSDTAVKTAVTGYIQRRLVKMMEDFRVCYRGSVRSSQNRLVEFSYGGDGADASLLEKVQLRVILMTADEVRASLCSNAARPTATEAGELERVCALLSRARTSRLGGTTRTLDPMTLLPFSPQRLLQNVRNSGDDLDVAGALGRITALADEMLGGTRPRVNTALALQFCFCTKVLRQVRVSQSKFDAMLRVLQHKCRECLVDAGEMVGTLAAQSIGEPITQMTLNSVDWHTTMVIHWTGTTPPPAPPDAEVGAFIDALVAERPAECQVQADGRTIYLPLQPGSAIALSPDDKGVMVWTELEAVTRHPPINRDGSATLVKVTTASGRSITVTKGKSLLVERNGRLVDVDGDAVVLGDRVPVVLALPPSTHQSQSIDLHSIFRETEVIFSNTMREVAQVSSHPRWFVEGGFRARSCYSRSDSMLRAIKRRPQLLKPDRVWWPKGGAFLPMCIALDRDFGFFVGAYLAEGCVTTHQVHISNVDAAYRGAACAWPGRHGIKCHVTHERHRSKNGGGTSISAMFHSSILVHLMVRTCGKGSSGKRVPGFAFAAPDDFVRGLLDGYISGDGSLDQQCAHMTAWSRSRTLRDGIALLLARFGAECRLRQDLRQDLRQAHVRWGTAEDGRRTQTMYGEKTPMYGWSVDSEGTRRFAEHVCLTLSSKRKRCNEILSSSKEDTHFKRRFEPLNHVRLEEITELEDVHSSREYVYDLTVAATRNMTATSGVAVRDTFHYSGVASKNNTVVGIPRLKEVLDCTKKCKTPSTVLFLRSPFCEHEEFARQLSRTLAHTKLGTLTRRTEIIYDPDPETSVVEEDRLLVELDAMFEQVPPDSARWVARLILNKDEMQARGLVPVDVCEHLTLRLKGKAHCCYSESNALEWIIRIRLADVAAMTSHGFDHEMRDETEQALVHRIIAALLEQLHVFGHRNVSSAREKSIETWDGVKNRSVFVVETLGTILADAALMPVVQWEQTSTNDLNEALEVLGIEACMFVTLQEISNVISFDGTYVDKRHTLQVRSRAQKKKKTECP